MLRQPLVVVMGNVDAGKCIHPSSWISLHNGELIRIKDLWDKLEPLSRVEEDSDGIFLQPNLDLYNVNFSDKKFEKKKAIRLYKLKSPKNLVYCKNSLGNEILVTEEHPFFILDNLSIKTKPAKDIKSGDFILCPKKIKRDSWNHKKIRNYIITSLLEDDRFLFKLSEEKNNEINKITREKKIFSKYTDKIKYNRYRNNHLKELHALVDISSEDILAIKNSTRNQREGHNSSWIYIPHTKERLLDLFYLVGLIFGDGTVQNTQLTNIDESVHKESIRIFKEVLKVNAKLFKPEMKVEGVSNSGGKTLEYFLNIIFSFPEEKKSNNLRIPSIIEKSNDEFIGQFLSGYFDTDGHVSNKGHIELCSASREIYEKLPLLLSYLGCTSQCYTKKNKKYNKDYHYISIAGKENLKVFQKIINFKIIYKKEQLEANIKMAISDRKSDIFPLSKDELRDLRINLGLSQNQIDVPYWGNYENKQSLTKEVFNKFIDFCLDNKSLIEDKINQKKSIISRDNKIKSLYNSNKSNFKTYNILKELSSDNLISLDKESKSYSVTEKGKNLSQTWQNFDINSYLQKLLSLKPLLNTEVHFIKVKEKKIVKSDTDFVYDLSEPFNENFISNGFVVHNTRCLDTIRRTAVVESEAGGITQMISSSAIPLKTLQKICGDLLKNKNINLPGLVFIDTPGHAAFSNMRKRGGNLADIAILVININEGIKPQTEECINILKQYQTPFVIALNKIDLTPGWVDIDDKFILNRINKQPDHIKLHIETKLYEIVGKLHELGFQSERFDRVDDYTKTIAMVPTSAKFGPGIPELLMVLMGLAQKFLESKLETNLEGPAKGTVLEVKEEKGLGVTINAIIYEGIIRVNDPIIIGGLNEPVVTKIKGIFEPDEKGKFKPVKEVKAAAGVKISAVGIKEVVSGMPLFVINNNEEELRQKIQEEVDEVLIETESSGVVVKAESLGSLEAVIGMLKDKNIPIKKASVGIVTKKDITSAVSDDLEENKVILCFNIKAESDEVKIISHNIIYQLIEDLEKYREELRKKEEEKSFENLIRPAKVIFMQGCTFRQNNPCVVGVEIIQGTLRPDTELIKESGESVGHIKTIQLEKETVKKAERGKQVAISMPGVTAGRQIHEGEIFFVDMNENNFKSLKQLKKMLTPEEAEILKELALIKRKSNKFWGI